MKKIGLYIHIPFCEKKCDYCNFVSFCKPIESKLQYIDCLIKEISMQSVKFEDYEVDSIFIGGGTPSCLPFGAINKIMNAVYRNFKVLTSAEITIECNPNSLSFQKFQEFKKARINRLSIGLQTYNNKLLKLIGRLHTKKQFDDAIRHAKIMGFKNISADIILGIPKQTLFDVKWEIRHLLKLGLNHISAYGLIVEDGTILSENLKNGKYKLPSERTQVKMYDYVLRTLKNHGINRYEVSNFAKPGYESRHNLKYWTNQEYLGLGLTSSSYISGIRWKNTDNFDDYLLQVNNGKIEKYEKETLSAEDLIEERIMLSLRTSKGIDLEQFKKDFGFDLLQKKHSQIETLKNGKFVEISDGRLFCTDAGFKVLNQIILNLVD